MIRQVAFALVLFLLSTSPPTFAHDANDANDAARDANDAKDEEEEQQIVLTSPIELEDFQTGSFFRITGVGMFTASAGDLATTEWGLRYPGLTEGNPIAREDATVLDLSVLTEGSKLVVTEALEGGISGG